MAIKRVIITIIMASTLISIAYATPGRATYYMTTYLSSSCYGYTNQGTMIAAANPSLFDDKAACGKLYKIRCTGGTNATLNPCRSGEVTVKIVDLCPECGANQFDLSQEAFAVIADVDAGRINIDFNLD